MSPHYLAECRTFRNDRNYMIFRQKLDNLEKIAGYNVVQKLEFQTISEKGADKSYYRLR